nr:MAG TPA: hypothetical protein [Caudoviricetes sp.]
MLFSINKNLNFKPFLACGRVLLGNRACFLLVVI